MITIENLEVSFKNELSIKRQQVLQGISLNVEEGDCLGILGESGSGKSTLARVICGLLKPNKGVYKFLDKEPYSSKQDKKFLSENISVVFQDYNTSVNPRFTVSEIIGEAVEVLARRKKESINIKEKSIEYLKAVGLDESFVDRYPHQLSGGQLQRVCIARAIAVMPKVIVLDESISSLDAHTQVQIMELLKKLQSMYNLTYIFITHDLTAVTYLCNKVAFLYQGVITELIEVKNISSTKDEYARKLIDVVIEI